MALTNLAGGPRQISSQPRIHMKFLLGQERTKGSEMLHRIYFGTLIDILPFLSFSMRTVASGSLSLLTKVISSEGPPYESLPYTTSSLSEDRLLWCTRPCLLALSASRIAISARTARSSREPWREWERGRARARGPTMRESEYSSRGRPASMIMGVPWWLLLWRWW
jgi:hypothetical protein